MTTTARRSPHTGQNRGGSSSRPQPAHSRRRAGRSPCSERRRPRRATALRPGHRPACAGRPASGGPRPGERPERREVVADDERVDARGHAHAPAGRGGSPRGRRRSGGSRRAAPRRNSAIHRIASSGSVSGRSPSGVPGRGLRKLTGTSAGSTARSSSSSSRRCAVGLAHAEQHAAAQLHAVPAHQLAGVGPLLPGVGGDDPAEVRPGRLEVVVVAVHAALGEPPGLVLGEDAGAHRDVEPGLARAPAAPARGCAASSARRGPGPRARCRTRTRRARRSPRPRPAPRRCRGTGVAFTGVSNADDCEQKWQSSGQPPVLADRIPSTSTCGPHHASRTSWASAASAGHRRVGHAGQRRQLVAGEQAPLVEQRAPRRPGSPAGPRPPSAPRSARPARLDGDR